MSNNICMNCRHYLTMRNGDVFCAKSNKPAAALAERPCFESRAEQAPAAETTVAKGNHGGGRKAAFPNRTNPETGQVEKHCRVCGEYKPIESFPHNRTHNDGHASECKECHNRLTVESNRRRSARKMAAREESPAPAAAAPEKPSPAGKASLSSYTDRELADELHARGWAVTLSMNLNVS